ncbi:effector-associated constant component EACC1 [Longispora albida]|uniref:effector-associated constant component EACC1 n=1 Tax=Longispora albida TaxID=203523 RepID=UPI0003775B51|nr:hypothetical protein [Longispora albida]
MTLEIAVVPGTVAFDADDPAWLAQVEMLVRELQESEVDGVGQRATASPGEKSAVIEILVALGSSGAVTAALAAFSAWLGRDKRRELNVVVDGVRHTVDGTALSDRTLREVMLKSLETKRLDG